ncbi:MAG: hypothetical protein WAO02_10325 [Verrucomicrobiia bacterium]
MKLPSLLSATLLIAVGSLLLSGCVTRERVVYRPAPPPATVGEEVVVAGAPPPPIVETVAIAPGPAYVWVGGGWVWRGNWVWQSGRWMRPPHPGAVWVPHQYVYRNGVHVYIRGGWRY